MAGAFKSDYIFWFNMVFAVITSILVYYNIKKKKKDGDWKSFNFLLKVGFKCLVVYLFALIILVELALKAFL
ncbi:hypothetical protein [Tenacibaculum sp.]|uniref:hypothetical protein n=1 Tax=Tenacibaculum sp. TaxID=1906242 RepID=UPI003D0FDB12